MDYGRFKSKIFLLSQAVCKVSHARTPLPFLVNGPHARSLGLVRRVGEHIVHKNSLPPRHRRVLLFADMGTTSADRALLQLGRLSREAILPLSSRDGPTPVSTPMTSRHERPNSPGAQRAFLQPYDVRRIGREPDKIAAHKPASLGGSNEPRVDPASGSGSRREEGA